jgi:hypothetical protein
LRAEAEVSGEEGMERCWPKDEKFELERRSMFWIFIVEHSDYN